ncbi:MAG: putative rane protein [Ramlibacter sp.]|nr:putative rane protein [Ramlibacter sp.]
MIRMPEQARFILLYVVFPLWVVAGFADWACHRRTGIALTSGLKENLLHLLMFAEIGVAMVAVALLEINAAVLVLVFAVFLVHELTVYWDLHYSTLLRDVGPFEQMVHSFLEILPLLSLALLAAFAWPQALALVGIGEEARDWALRLRADPLPPALLRVGLLLSVAFNLLPLLQETWSCAVVRSARAARRPVVADGPTVRIPPNPEPR